MRIAAIRIALVLMSIFVLASIQARAEEPTRYDRVQLSAQATMEVSTDVLVAELSAQRQGKDAGKLANEVNQLVRAALQKCNQNRSVEAQTLGYNTTPVYENGHQSGWRVSQSLQVKSRDPVVLGKLLGELQQKFVLTSMGYQVSAEQRNKFVNKLVSKAISDYRARALLITRELGHKRYRIVHLQINTSGIDARPVRRFNALRMQTQSAEPVQIAAGKQSLIVTASGVIELE